MSFLIDTHILLWFMVGDKRMHKNIRSIVEDEANTIFLSNASLWEIAIKASIGKLKLNKNFDELKAYMTENQFVLLEFDFNDLQTLQTLPFHHQDPFDRLIIAQAKTKFLQIITNDKQVESYF